jgi:hypothetical protein
MRRVVEYEWQDALQDAVHERDPREIEGRVLRAEIAAHLSRPSAFVL